MVLRDYRSCTPRSRQWGPYLEGRASSRQQPYRLLFLPEHGLGLRYWFVLDQLTKSSCYLATNPSLTCTSQACACSAYQVYKDGYCVSCQAKNCLLCSLNDPQQCDVCQKGYVLDSLTKTECVPQQNFSLSCLSNSCSCSPFQVNINGVCTDCKASNCLLCSATDATECDVCKNGYVLDTLTKKTCVLKTNTSLSCNLGSCGCSLF